MAKMAPAGVRVGISVASTKIAKLCPKRKYPRLSPYLVLSQGSRMKRWFESISQNKKTQKQNTHSTNPKTKDGF